MQENSTTRKARESPFRSRIIGIKVDRREQRRMREGGRKFSQSPNEAHDFTLRQEG